MMVRRVLIEGTFRGRCVRAGAEIAADFAESGRCRSGGSLPQFVGRAFTPAADLAENGCCRVGRNCGGRLRCVGADACIGPRGLQRRKHPRRARSPALQFVADGQQNREQHPPPGGGTMPSIVPYGGRGNWRRRSGGSLPRFVGRAFTPAADLAESGRCRVGRNCGGRLRCVGADACTAACRRRFGGQPPKAALRVYLINQKCWKSR